MSDPVAQFYSTLESAFGPLEFLPTPDGEINRFHVPGNRAGSENGWYILCFGDSIVYGCFGSWKVGGSWHGNPADPPWQRERCL